MIKKVECPDCGMTFSVQYSSIKETVCYCIFCGEDLDAELYEDSDVDLEDLEEEDAWNEFIEE
jgi:hypothetical protein